MYEYLHFAEFGNPMNSIMGQKKRPNALKRTFNTIQTHTTTYLSYIYFFLKNQKKKYIFLFR